eukprot:337850_1
MCNWTSLLGILLQALAAIASAISTGAIINSVQLGYLGINIKNEQQRAIVIIIAASTELFLQLCKISFVTRKAFRTVGYDCNCNCIYNIPLFLRSPSFNTKFKAFLVGLVDCSFDIIAAMSLMYDVNFTNVDLMQHLIIFGTFIGLGEETLELIIETVLGFAECVNVSNRCCFGCLVCFSTIEIIGSLIEIGISIYIAIHTADATFSILCIIVLSFLGCCLCCNGFIYEISSIDTTRNWNNIAVQGEIEDVEMAIKSNASDYEKYLRED